MVATEITINTQEDVVSVGLGDPSSDATIAVQEIPDQVTLDVVAPTDQVNLDVSTTVEPVNVEVSSVNEPVLISVFESQGTTIYKAIAGEEIEPFRLVRIAADQKIYKSTLDTPSSAQQTLGMILQNGIIGHEVFVMLFGVVEFAGWSWVFDKPLFLALDGQITQNPAQDSPFWLQIGKVMAPNRILLSISEAVLNGIA